MNFRCIMPCAPLRINPADQAEIVSQVRYGEIVEMIEIDDKKQWMKVRCVWDEYIGYIERKNFVEWIDTKPQYFYAGPTILLDDGNVPVLIGFGSLLLEVQINKSIEKYILHQKLDKADAIAMLSRYLVGVPYLWGGRSSFGIDCSGLSQLYGQLLGLQLPRDAWLQAQYLSANIDKTPFLEGDFVFFENPDRRIVHVGMIFSINNELLHASGCVRIDEFTVIENKVVFRKINSNYFAFSICTI